MHVIYCPSTDKVVLSLEVGKENSHEKTTHSDVDDNLWHDIRAAS